MFTLNFSDRRPPTSLPSACHAAWCDAYDAHLGQVRSFDQRPYMAHPTAVGAVLSAWGWDDGVVKVGLLHDTLEDSDLSIQTLAQRHGPDVARAVSALSKNKALPKAEQGAEAKCRLALSLPSLGPSVGLVKLVDRAHNMVTASHLPREKQQALVSDAHYFFAPLAKLLGLSRLAIWFEACCPAQLGWSDQEFVQAMVAFTSEAHPQQVSSAWRGQTMWRLG